MKKIKYFLLAISCVFLSEYQVYSQDNTSIAYVDYSQIKSTHSGIQSTHQEFLKKLDTAKAVHNTNLLALDTIPETSGEIKRN